MLSALSISNSSSISSDSSSPEDTSKFDMEPLWKYERDNLTFIQYVLIFRPETLERHLNLPSHPGQV